MYVASIPMKVNICNFRTVNSEYLYKEFQNRYRKWNKRIAILGIIHGVFVD